MLSGICLEQNRKQMCIYRLVFNYSLFKILSPTKFVWFFFSWFFFANVKSSEMQVLNQPTKSSFKQSLNCFCTIKCHAIWYRIVTKYII